MRIPLAHADTTTAQAHLSAALTRPAVEPGCDVVASFADDGAKPAMCMLRRFVRGDRWAVWLKRIAEPDTAAKRFPKAALSSVHRMVGATAFAD